MEVQTSKNSNVDVSTFYNEQDPESKGTGTVPTFSNNNGNSWRYLMRDVLSIPDMDLGGVPDTGSRSSKSYKRVTLMVVTKLR